MDDEGGDWFGGDDPVVDDAPAAGGAATDAGGAADAGAPAGEEGEAPAEEVPAAEEEHQYIDPDKVLLFKHWVRPRFLQYAYMYDYRHNYYDDVIDYLDRRQKGISREIPRAQTWAERSLRTYNSKFRRSEASTKQEDDVKLLSNIRFSNSFHRYHSKEYINRRYSSLM